MVDLASPLEATFIMMKPDGVKRGLVGKVFQRLEQQGLKLIAARMVQGTEAQVAEHYPADNEDWLRKIGEKTEDYFEGNLEKVKAAYGTTDKVKIGKIVYENMMKYITDGPVIISVWQGNQAVERVRRLTGHMIPTVAEIGTLREEFGLDTPALAIQSGRIAFRNVLHISDSPEEAKREIGIWFKGKYKQLDDYERIDYIDMV